MPEHRSHESHPEIVKRLKRAEGHLRSIVEMIEGGRSCVDKVLRGGCWATSARIGRPAYRNFFTPDRSDVFAGFRTCAI